VARTNDIESQVKALQLEALTHTANQNQTLARKGFEQAAALAIQTYGAELRGWLTRKLKDSTLADDLFQEVCAGLWRGLPHFRWGTPENPCSLRTWAYKIAFYAICHHHRSAPQDPVWSKFLRELQTLPKEHPDTKKIIAQSKAAHRRMLRARDLSEDAEREAFEIEQELLRLVGLMNDAAFARHKRWLQENASAMAQSLLSPPIEANFAQSELSQIAEEISSMGNRIDKQNQLLECLQQLKEQDRLIILLRQLEGGVESWKEIARALHGYRSMPDEEIDAEAARLRQRFHRSMEELKGIAKAKGLVL
jgi:RNA polymerase sigma factor (sigma-70 family)